MFFFDCYGVFLVIFVFFFLVEMGDKMQIVMVLLVGEY